MFKNMFIKNYYYFLFLFSAINFFYFVSCKSIEEINTDSQEQEYSTLYELEAINEIKKQLYDIYNYIMINNFVPAAENISSVEINEIIEKIIYTEEIYNNLLPIIMIQLDLKAQNKINNDKALLNLNIDFHAAVGFYSSMIAQICFSCNSGSNSSLRNTFSNLIKVALLLSTTGQLFTLIVKRKLASRRDYISKTNNMLQEKKMEMNNILVNLLISALEEKVKL